jgi:uncharacterized protein
MPADEVIFYGHPNVRCLHNMAIEITRESHLTLRGDCILGVRANKACRGLDPLLKRALQEERPRINVEITVDGHVFMAYGTGTNRLSLLSEQDIVIRKSNFVCPRTLLVRCNNASSSIPRDMVKLLQNKGTRGVLRIEAQLG